MLYRGAYLLSGEGGNQPEVLSFFRHGWKECGSLASCVKEKRSRVTSMEENEEFWCQISLLVFVHFASFFVATQPWLLCCPVFLSLMPMLQVCGTHQLKLDSFCLPRPGGEHQSWSRAWAHLFLKILAYLHSWPLLDPRVEIFCGCYDSSTFSRDSSVFLFLLSNY